MGIRQEDVTDAMKERMDPRDKEREIKRRGRRAMETTNEAVARELLRLEREDHSEFAGYLNLKGIEFEHDDPTQRSTNRKGWPDFRCYYPFGLVLFVEFKRRPNKLTKEQEEVRRYLEGAGFPYVVAYSLSDGIEAVNKYLLKR
jgi:hypothetical protein